jgi:hypothetical protein
VLDHIDPPLLLLLYAERPSLTRVSITNVELQRSNLLLRKAWHNPPAIHACELLRFRGGKGWEAFEPALSLFADLLESIPGFSRNARTGSTKAPAKRSHQGNSTHS